MPHHTPHAPPAALLLSTGDMPSFLAAAMHAQSRLAILFIHDGHPASDFRQQAVIQQADSLLIQHRTDLVLSHLARYHPAAATPSAQQPALPAPLAQLQLLAAAAAHALQLNAQRLIYPLQLGHDFNALAQTTESLTLLTQLLALTTGRQLAIETPLLELTDRQIVEIGQQMQLPWELARSCHADSRLPCAQCPACRRRADAFNAAAIEDPLIALH